MKDYIKFKLKPVKYKITALHGNAMTGEVRTAYVVCKNDPHEYKMGATVALLFHPAESDDCCPFLGLAVLGEDGFYRAYDKYTYLNLGDENVSANDWDWKYSRTPTADKNTRNTKNEGDNMKDYVEELLEGKEIYTKEGFKSALEDLQQGETIISCDLHGRILQLLFSEGLVESNENSELSLTEKGEAVATELFGVPVSIKHNQYCAEQIIAHIEEALNFVSEFLPPCSDRIEDIEGLLQDVYNEAHVYVLDFKNQTGDRNE